MKSFFAATLAAAASAKMMTSSDYAFINYVAEFSKSYATTEEFEARKEHFLNFNHAVNAINSNPDSMSVAGHNEYSDNTPEEWDRMMGLKMPEPMYKGEKMLGALEYPSSVDWRAQGAVTEVKNQGSCGSCWAFSSTGALESAYFIKNGSLPLLSEQQLVDCSSSYGNDGCGGGWYYWSYDYLRDGKNLETESEYPYAGVDQTCSDRGDGVVTDKSYT